MRYAVRILSMNAKTILLLSILSTYLPMLAQGNHAEQQRSIENITIDLNVKDVSLSEVFRQITKSTKIRFSYRNADLERVPPVSIRAEKGKLQQVLNQLTNTHGLEWKLLNDVIVIRKQEVKGYMTLIIQDTTFQIRGIVRDENNNPVPGVSIIIKRTTKGTTSNENGEFTLTNNERDVTLVFSSMGFLKQEIRYRGESFLDIKMQLEVKEIEAVSVVSTGYQDIPKERATGSFYKLDNELISRSVSTNILDRLIGVTSGLNFDPQNDNSTSRRRDVTIRGISTINANQRPLLVVDGFSYEEPAAQFSNFTAWINNVNPNDIESITVLKDAAAASIWGARAGNGVIVITTKKGRFNQRPKIQFISNLTISDKPDLFYTPKMSPSDFIDFEITQFNKGWYDADLQDNFTMPAVSQVIEILNRRRTGLITSSDSAMLIDQLRKVDLRNEIDKHLNQLEVNQQYGLNLSGGSGSYNYFASIGYDKNRNSSVGSNYRRLSFRFDNSFRPAKNLDINAYINFVQNKNRNGDAEFTSSPYTSLLGDDQEILSIPYSYRQVYVDTAKSPNLLDWNYRPLDELKNNRTDRKHYDIRIGGRARYNIINGLNAEIKYQYQKGLTNISAFHSQESYFVRNLVNRYMSISRNNGSTIVYPIPLGAIMDRIASEYTNWNVRGQLDFNKNWIKHDIVALIGIEAKEALFEGKGTDRIYGYDPETGTTIPLINYDSIYMLRPFGSGYGRVPGALNTGTDRNINRFISYYANGAYTFLDKYAVSASARVDGSNFFGTKTNQKMVPLLSVGTSWNLSNESFYHVTWLTFLKARFTYGFNGNMRNDATAYPTILYRNNASITGSIYADVETPGNPQLRWEKVRMINYGIDFSVGKDRISGSLEYYTKKGIDMLGPILADPTSGLTSYFGNRSSFIGNGIDIILNFVNTKGRVYWITNLLISRNTDKVTAYETAGTSESNKNVFFSGLVINKPLDALYSYRWAGLDPETGAPRVYTSDTITAFNRVNQDAKPTDLVYHGTQSPKWFGSVRNSVRFKNITFSANVIFKFAYFFRRSSIDYVQLLQTYSSGGHKDFIDRWKAPGDEIRTNIPSIPATVDASRDAVFHNSDILVERADHIRLQDIRLSYDFKNSNFPWLPFRNIQLYTYVNNIGLLWKANKQGVDPDFSGYSSIPNPRTMALGLNVSF